MASKSPASRGIIHPIILSGGSGTRLWPLSRAQYPKQFFPILSERTLLQEVAARVADARRHGAPLIVANEEHRFVVAEQLRAIGVAPRSILLEPFGRNTAPAIAVAALAVLPDDPEALLLVLPSDHAVGDKEAFARAVDMAARAGRSGRLVAFGIRPERPETGYGYIKIGAEILAAPGAHEVARFVEKPDRKTAEAYLAAGDFVWNSGMFLFPARLYLDELERLRPGMVERCRAALDAATRDLDFVRLDRAAFEACPSISVDYAVMEKTDKAAVVPAAFGWSDVGAWDSLHMLGAKDGDGNVVVGDALAIEAKGSYLRSQGRVLVALGVEDLIVVATEDAVLVTPRARAQEVKRAVAALEARGRTEGAVPPIVHRPWGSYQRLDGGDRFQVKHITVRPGGRLSLQKHRRRAEHWIVVNGTAKVTCEDRVLVLKENESTFIPMGSVHRLENPGDAPLRLIEVQSGGYLGEDDIVRLDDSYGRK